MRAALAREADLVTLTRRATEYDVALDGGLVQCFIARVALDGGAAPGPTLACAHGDAVLVGAEGFRQYLRLRQFRPEAPFAPGDRLLSLADRFGGITGRRYLEVATRTERDALHLDGRVVITPSDAPPDERWFIARITPDGTLTFHLRPPR